MLGDICNRMLYTKTHLDKPLKSIMHRLLVTLSLLLSTNQCKDSYKYFQVKNIET